MTKNRVMHDVDDFQDISALRINEILGASTPKRLSLILIIMKYDLLLDTPVQRLHPFVRTYFFYDQGK